MVSQLSREESKTKSIEIEKLYTHLYKYIYHQEPIKHK